MTIKKVKIEDIKKLGVISSELAKKILERMNNLGVKRLANVYLKHKQSQVYGEQDYLHVDGFDGDLLLSDIDNSDDYFYRYGDFNLPTYSPSYNAVKEFLSSIHAVNEAIEAINSDISAAIGKDYTIK